MEITPPRSYLYFYQRTACTDSKPPRDARNTAPDRSIRASAPARPQTPSRHDREKVSPLRINAIDVRNPSARIRGIARQAVIRIAANGRIDRRTFENDIGPQGTSDFTFDQIKERLLARGNLIQSSI